MDLQEVADRVRLPVRRIRYVLDHQVMPGLRAAAGAGRPRSLTALEGFWVAAAALLFVGGVQRPMVAKVLDWLINTSFQPSDRVRPGRTVSILDAAYPDAGGPIAVEVGDGVSLRVVTGSAADPWIAPGHGAAFDAEYAPRVIVRLNLAVLRASWAGAE